jgi:uncharacterized membrane protein
MTASTPRKKTRYAKLRHSVQLHLKLVAALVLGIVTYVVLVQLGTPARVATRVLIAWNVGVLFYLVAVTWVIGRSDLRHLRDRAAEEDEGAALVLMLSVAAAVASLAAIFVELGTTRKEAGALALLLALSTVVLSWWFIQAIFAFHYAHEFYGEAEGGQKGGLKFPGDGAKQEEQKPEYSDFLYFSVVIGMTFQVSDVQVTSKSLRRVVAAHGVVSFFYNVAVLALMVNIGGEFIKG